MLTVTVANLKGGTAKTTTAAFLAHCLGPRTLAIDADPPGSLLRWSEMGDWPLPVIGLPVKDLHTRLPGMNLDGYDSLVIDTPPLEDQAGIVHSALRAADVVLVPVAPSTMEIDRLSPIVAALDDIAPLRDRPPALRVLLTRVVSRATSTDNARDVLTEAGLSVLPTVIPRLERYAQAFGGPVKVGPDDPYTAATNDLLNSIKESRR